METWDEIKKHYPNEHVVIVNPQCPVDRPAVVEAGDVFDHNADLDALLGRGGLPDCDSFAVLYTGDLGALIGERGMIRVIEND